MTEVCEVWMAGELAALILGTVTLSTAGVAAIIAACMWWAHKYPETTTDPTHEGRVRSAG